MKIIGFAHLGFAFPISQFPVYMPNSIKFIKVLNTPEKKLLMLKKSKFHNLQIDMNGLEFLFYTTTKKRENKYLLRDINFFQTSKNLILSPNFNHTFLMFIEALARKSTWLTDEKLQICGLGGLSDATLGFDKLGLIFGNYLDEEGLVSIAFYVNEIDSNKVKELISDKSAIVTSSFEIKIGVNLFNILFVKTEGVIIEFIQRK
jgi:hypothetical protein